MSARCLGLLIVCVVTPLIGLRIARHLRGEIMPDVPKAAAESPAALVPVYPYGQPAEPIALHEGDITIGDQTEHGVIEYRLSPGAGVRWRFKGDRQIGLRPVTLCLQPATGGPAELSGRCDRSRTTVGDSGSLNSCVLGSSDARMDHVVVHWLNAPEVQPDERISDRSAGRDYWGRWSAEVSGWAVVVDARPDLDEVWERAKQSGSIVMTHTMKVSRSNGDEFTAEEVDPLLDAMQLGMSFAVGRWVSPALPVGFDKSGNRVWEQWFALHCTPGNPGPIRWWTERSRADLIKLLEVLAQRVEDPDEQFSIRFMLSSAVLSAAGGFMEQRIMTGFAALEHLMWRRLVPGTMSERDYKNTTSNPAYKKLKLVLDEAGIPDDVNEPDLPSLYAWVQNQQDPNHRTWHFAACKVRNLIVHPTDSEEKLYKQDEMVIQEAWILTHHYLLLLLLHHLGYDGGYERQVPPGGWSGNVTLVPWATDQGGINHGT
jgi:hypothetical protein